MPVSVKVGGAWKTATAVFNKVGGVWKTASDMPVKIAGVWKTGILARNSYESIATYTPTSGTTVTFSSIPSTYKSLQLRINYITTTGANMAVYVQFNGSSTGYVSHNLMGDGSSVYAENPYGTPASFILLNSGNYGNINTYANAFIADIIDYASTTKTKVLRRIQGQDNNAGNTTSIAAIGSGLWNNTSAINSITLVVGAQFVAGTSIALYGIKDA